MTRRSERPRKATQIARKAGSEWLHLNHSEEEMSTAVAPLLPRSFPAAVRLPPFLECGKIMTEPARGTAPSSAPLITCPLGPLEREQNLNELLNEVLMHFEAVLNRV